MKNKQTKSVIIFSAILVLTGIFAWAAERGTADEAKALLAKAIEHYKQVGRVQALADFNSKKTPWLDRDLYVVCLDSKHILVANGGYPEYVGKTMLDLTTAKNGKPLGQALWDSAQNGGSEIVEWVWFNPLSKNLESKAGLTQKADADITCTVGYYKP